MIQAARLSDHQKYFESALQRHSRLTVRQETEPSVDVEELFTDNKQLPALLSSDWQIVYGRRGTGKTTLLSVLSKDIDAEETKASLMISMSQCVIDLPKGTDPAVIGLVYFEKFIIEIGHLLFRIYQNRRAQKNQNRKLTRLLNTYLDRQKLVEECILQIATFAHRGEVFGTLDAKQERVKEISKSQQGVAARLGLNLPKMVTWSSIQAVIEARYSRQREINRARTYVEEKFIDFQELRRTFKELLEALQIDQLTIIIDEWSELDRSGTSWIQPFFARYLKRAFFGDPQFCVKISAIRDESVFGKRDHEGQYIGLEVGDDIFDAVNLDWIYANRIINLEEFYTILLFRRLLHCEPKLSVFSRDLGSNKKEPADGFAEYLFGNNDLLPEIITASNGIPRQFITIFETIAAHYNYKIRPKWKHSAVRDRIIHGCITYIEKNIDSASVERHLLERIKNVVDSTQSKIVCLPRDAHRKVNQALRNLYGRRLLHECEPSNIPFEIRERYFIYRIDHGCFLDWTRKFPRNGDNDSDAAALAATLAEIGKFVVNVQGLQDLKLCPRGASNGG